MITDYNLVYILFLVVQFGRQLKVQMLVDQRGPFTKIRHMNRKTGIQGVYRTIQIRRSTKGLDKRQLAYGEKGGCAL